MTTVPAAGFAAARSAAQLVVKLLGITLAGVLVLSVRRGHETRPARMPRP